MSPTNFTANVITSTVIVWPKFYSRVLSKHRQNFRCNTLFNGKCYEASALSSQTIQKFISGIEIRLASKFLQITEIYNSYLTKVPCGKQHCNIRQPWLTRIYRRLSKCGVWENPAAKTTRPSIYSMHVPVFTYIFVHFWLSKAFTIGACVLHCLSLHHGCWTFKGSANRKFCSLPHTSCISILSILCCTRKRDVCVTLLLMVSHLGIFFYIILHLETVSSKAKVKVTFNSTIWGRT